MTTSLADWQRPLFSAPSGSPFLFYVAYGRIDPPYRIAPARYRFAGLAPGLDFMEYGRDGEQAEVVASFRDGPVWDQLKAQDPALAEAVEAQTHCIVVRGTYDDGPVLNDLRSAIGLLAYLVDSGCCAVYDPLMYRWWSADEWRNQVFGTGELVPPAHVSVLYFKEEDGERDRIETRGLRKFGRPDLSMRNVASGDWEPAMALCSHLIQRQVLGDTVTTDDTLSAPGLGRTLRGVRKGGQADPQFDNDVLEIDFAADP